VSEPRVDEGGHTPAPFGGTVWCIADIRFPMERANGIQTVQTAHALARSGARVRLLVRYLDPRRAHRPPLSFYDLNSHPDLDLIAVAFAGPLGRLRFLSASLVHLASGSPSDVVLTRDLVLADAILHMPTRLRPRLVYEAHTIASVFADERRSLYDQASDSSDAKRRRLDRREARVCRGADGLVMITEHLRAALAARHGTLPISAVVADGCHVPDSAPERPASTSPHVVYIGQLYPWKGVDRLIEAIGLVPRCRLTVVGGLVGEPDRIRIQELVQRLNLGSRIRLEGFVAPAELERFRREATLFVIPNLAGSQTSERYTSPLKLFEAMAANRPIVASDLPSLREILSHEHNALLVRPGDPRAIAEAVARLASDLSLGERLSRQAFRDVQSFSWIARAERLRVLFGRLDPAVPPQRAQEA